MSLRRTALNAIADALAEGIKLAAPPTIVDAPPSEPAQYPAMAILMDRFTTNWSQSWDIETDAAGNPLLGTAITLERGVTVSKLENNRYLSRYGTLQGEGRIWVAARQPAKREELEEAVLELFTRDGMVPGRLLINMVNAKVGNFTVPWPWTVAAMVEDTTWKDELAMVERIWSYLNFRLDVDLLVARTEPLVQQFLVDFNDQQYTLPFPTFETTLSSWSNGFSIGFGG